MIFTLLTSPLLTYAQTTGAISTGNILSEPEQTTVFFADPEKAAEIVESADTTYYSESQISFSADNAKKSIEDLDQGVKELRNQIIKLDRKYGTEDKQYLETRNEVVTIINDIEQTKDVLAASIKKIYFYQSKIVNSVDKVNTIRANLAETKNYIEKFSQFMFKINNEYYNIDGTLDELKLFIKSDGQITEQLSNTAMIETVMDRMNTLMDTMTKQEKETIEQIKSSNQNRTAIRKIISEYEARLKTLQDQRKFL